MALKGPVTTPVGEGFTSVNVGLRKALELYANLRPVYNLPGVPSRFQNVDLVIVRENTEDLYAGLEHTIIPGVVESLKIITAVASERIAQFAFEHARTYRRKKVTAVHKANIMKMSDGLFLESVRKIAKGFPEIPYEEKIVDNACMQLVMRPGSSTSSCCRTSTATSCRTCAPPRRRTRRRTRRQHRPQASVFEAVHARRPTSPAGPGQPDGAAAVGTDDAAPHRRGRRRDRVLRRCCGCSRPAPP